MKKPLFRICQRVYVCAAPLHGKVLEIYEYEGHWKYTVRLDRPNPKNKGLDVYSEADLRATLEEAVAWQEAEMGAWRCTICYQPNAWGAPKCSKCGRAKPK